MVKAERLRDLILHFLAPAVLIFFTWILTPNTSYQRSSSYRLRDGPIG